MKIKFWALLAAGMIGAGAILGWMNAGSAADKDTGKNAGQAPPPAEVTVKTIVAQAVDITRDLPGRTVPYKIAEIRPQVNGIVVKRLFEEGADVKAGQQLYQIDPAVYQAAYDSAQADLMKAQANAKSVVSKGQRYAELVKIGGVSKQEYDDIQASVAQGNADIAIAKASLAQARINLNYTKVFSPIDGRIGKSAVTEGALVTQGQTMPLTVVQQLDPIYVDVTQASSELLALRRQLKASGGEAIASKRPVTLFIEGDTQGYAQKGELQFSDVSVDESTGSVQFRVLFPNPDHQLLPGMFVKARIGQSEKDQAILVPQKATTRTPDGSASVMLVGDGDKAVSQPIKVSNVIGDQWLVIEGLKPGDRLIVEGYQKAKPGSVVKPVEAQSPGQARQENPAAPANAKE